MVGTLRLKSNRESKIAESKAALCCGFAIALRALFWDSLLGDFVPVDCFASLAMTKIAHAKKIIVMLSEAKHLYAWNLERFYLSVIARGASLVAINRVEHSETFDCRAS
ncbi:MAG: hypothetical protein K2N69_08145 [Helicobacter sp.]|nr:hypothetical protein [Helicobacter sp.]